MEENNIVYDVLLVSQHYKPIVGYAGPEKYICIFTTRTGKKLSPEMNKYVKRHGFVTPDGQFSVKDVVLRKRTYTGEEISRMSYIEIFDGLDRRRTLKGGKDD